MSHDEGCRKCQREIERLRAALTAAEKRAEQAERERDEAKRREQVCCDGTLQCPGCDDCLTAIGRKASEREGRDAGR